MGFWEKLAAIGVVSASLSLVSAEFLEQQHRAFPRVQQCSVAQGGGLCPLDNTCCPIHLPNTNNADGATTTKITSGCIPSDLGASVATCCPDQRTGCGVGYQCAQRQNQSQTLHNNDICMATPAVQDPLVQVLPRYPLCRLSRYSNFRHMERFSSPPKFPTAQMLYYSSHGDLEDMVRSTSDNIRMVLIVIHGANRNANDYFCAASAAVALQTHYTPDQVLLLAPRFVIPGDLPPSQNDDDNNQHVLQWDGSIANGAWRYGANAITPKSAQNVSSFDVLDAFLETLRVRLPPHIHGNITVVGHSSGGQFVQRWALVSNEARQVQAVVANPSSYAYLTPERYDATMGDWRALNYHDNCSHYNLWEWGLNVSSETPGYVRRILQSTTQRDLINRFGTRRMVYMIGSLDRCNVSSSLYKDNVAPAPTKYAEPWCFSHGLETTCMDQWQGTYRWERNARYMDMLQRIMPIKAMNNHVKIVVPGVGHDHSLMFSSPQGLQVLFLASATQTKDSGIGNMGCDDDKAAHHDQLHSDISY